MDGPHFDGWTRRHFGFAVSGFAASHFGLAAGSAAAKKENKDKKKPRCRKLLQGCAPQGKQQRCCSGLNCDPVNNQEGLRCCYGRQHTCQSAGQCCGGALCEDVAGLGGERCCGGGGAFCASNQDCCFDAACLEGECVFFSDRTLKENIAPIDPVDMLRRVRSLPISAWNYTSDDPSIRHIGPMAQDFAALFDVGADDRHIHPLDGQGVALAAIQGLLGELQALRTANAHLVDRVAALERERP